MDAAVDDESRDGSGTGTGAEVVAVYDTVYSNGITYAAFEDIGFWRSDDRGATYTRATGQNAGLYRSSDNGATGARLTGNLHLTRIWDITTFPDQPNLLFLSSDGAS